jgi:4-diphosphocytidyl-2-C-methyl-D-erythritol kinase
MPSLPPGVRLRDATPSDAEAIHALYHEAYDPTHDPHRAAAGIPLRDTVDDVRGYAREHALLVAERNGSPLATVQLRALANVRRLAVSPRARCEGLGAAMLDAAAERARQDGFDFLQLETLASHPWLAPFYARHGYVERAIEVMPDGARWLVMRQRL